MKSHNRLFLFLLASLAITVLLSPWLAVSWDRFVQARPGWEPYRFPFSRIFDRCFLITSILLFWPCRRFLKIGSAQEVGLAPRDPWVRDVAGGFACAAASMVFLVAVMTLQNVFTPFFRLSLADSAARIANALLAGLSVGFLEELFFRGIFFKGLLEQHKPLRAFLLTNLFFAAVHFVQPVKEFQLTHYDPWGGARYLAGSFEPFLHWRTLFPGFTGLFLLGVVLSYSVLRTRTIFLAMGLHAGWVFALQSIRVFGDFRREDLGWMFGSTDPKIVSGVVTWIGILAVAVVVHAMTRRKTTAYPDQVTVAAKAADRRSREIG
jgi:membrane protease YdiL (CAAX protease family)